ncbi:hypothetical protein CCACVL1_25065 [Corchorus capsularis]|uniref:Uncharacterized protein n=1 Tax=Corchorus capsularis TaxID=210143 RepID=A0A1R3GM83_COCAP|nr:hypothetical protein CCACVL1_25065 [Corchorus capsularis]
MVEPVTLIVGAARVRLNNVGSPHRNASKNALS